MVELVAQKQTTTDARPMLPETRWLAGVIVPVLIIAFIILFFMPDRTDRHFAWPIRPQMSAMMLGATYLTGIFFFSTVLITRRWQPVRLGFLPVTVFASTLGIATILHWGRFTHDRPAFWLWTALYATTPFLVFLVWLRNERAARGEASEPNSLLLPHFVRIALGIIGFGGILVSLMLFFFPSRMIDIWPWTISPLTSRVLAGEFAVYSVFAVGLMYDRRWSSVSRLLRYQLASPVFFLAATIVSWPDFDTSNPLTWAFVASLVIVFVIGVPALYFVMESRARAAGAAGSPPAA